MMVFSRASLFTFQNMKIQKVDLQLQKCYYSILKLIISIYPDLNKARKTKQGIGKRRTLWFRKYVTRG